MSWGTRTVPYLDWRIGLLMFPHFNNSQYYFHVGRPSSLEPIRLKIITVRHHRHLHHHRHHHHHHYSQHSNYLPLLRLLSPLSPTPPPPGEALLHHRESSRLEMLMRHKPLETRGLRHGKFLPASFPFFAELARQADASLLKSIYSYLSHHFPSIIILH